MKEGGGLKKYSVTVPIAGAIFVEVEASSEQEACEKALTEDGVDLCAAFDEGAHEWESYSRIVDGNILHVTYDEIFAEEITDD